MGTWSQSREISLNSGRWTWRKDQNFFREVVHEVTSKEKKESVHITRPCLRVPSAHFDCAHIYLSPSEWKCRCITRNISSVELLRRDGERKEREKYLNTPGDNQQEKQDSYRVKNQEIPFSKNQKRTQNRVSRNVMFLVSFNFLYRGLALLVKLLDTRLFFRVAIGNMLMKWKLKTIKENEPSLKSSGFSQSMYQIRYLE